MEVLFSALDHGIDPDDMDHSLGASLVVEETGEDPSRRLVLGPDRSGSHLEPVVLDRAAGPAVIHAMARRTTYRDLLARR